MTNLIKVTPKIVNDIEFYVSNNGEEVGVSVSGLARLCGVYRTTISQLTNDLQSGVGRNAVKSLQSLSGKVFSPIAESSNGARKLLKD